MRDQRLDDEGILIGILLWTSGLLGMVVGLVSSQLLITQIAGTATITIHALLSEKLAGFVKLIMGWSVAPFRITDRGWISASQTTWIGALLAWGSLIEELLRRFGG